jgi:hypothetical protein
VYVAQKIPGRLVDLAILFTCIMLHRKLLSAVRMRRHHIPSEFHLTKYRPITAFIVSVAFFFIVLLLFSGK